MTPVRPRLAGSPFAAITKLIGQCGGVDPVSHFSNRSPSTVYKWTDPEQSDGAPFGLVCTLSEHFPDATAAAEHLALRAGGVFVPMPRGDEDNCLAALTAETADSTGQMMRQLIGAFSLKSDGGQSVTPAEARAALPDIEQAVRLIVEIHKRASAIATSDQKKEP